jgi:hypothetical protein
MPRPAYILLSLILFATHINLRAQTSVSGVINTYHKVVEVIPAKACLRVSSTAGLSVFDYAMIEQVKGAAVSTANNSTFGSISAMNNAGNYEIGIVCGIRGDSVFFIHEFKNAYTVSDFVQLVKIPVYQSAIVTDTLKAAAWNSTQGTGGVLALIVTNHLTLNAPVYADAVGFSGGSVRLLTGTCNNILQYSGYSYNAGTISQGGAYKGEGIAELAAGFSGGRGAAANGGGGGNDHNNGGAGGSNLSAGGGGGENNSTTGCTNKYPGVGGYALNSSSGSKLFFGGGGGSGHSNNTVTTHGGGNGGGLIFLKAGTLQSNGQKVMANGQAGAATTSDGAAGGGAGGTIIIDVQNFTDNQLIEANGGSGGNVDNGLLPNRCYGSGGGGSGGAVYLTGALPGSPSVVINTNGGAAGNAFNSSPASCNGTTNAGAGASGATTVNYTVARSTNPAGYCLVVALPVQFLYCKAGKEAGRPVLRWEMAQPGGVANFYIEHSEDGRLWRVIGVQQPDDAGPYHFIHKDAVAGNHFYRIKLITPGGDALYSETVRVALNDVAQPLQLVPNPARDRVLLLGCNKGLQMVQVFTADGRMVLQQPVQAFNGVAQLPLRGIPPGIYVLKLGGSAVRLMLY